MPRQNKPRTLGSEDTLAKRIAFEREQEDMTYDALARAMTEAGCPVDRSAIHRIEKGSPRRTISVDELVAVSVVFGKTVEDMLRPVALVEQEWAEDVARNFIDATDSFDDAHAVLVRAAVKLAEVHRRSPEVSEYVANRWNAASPGSQWFGEFVGVVDETQLNQLAGLSNAFWEQMLLVVDDLAQRDSS